MSGLVQSMIQSETGIITVLLFAFLCGASIFYLSYYFLSPSIDIRRRASEADSIGREASRMAGSSTAARGSLPSSTSSHRKPGNGKKSPPSTVGSRTPQI